MLNEIKELEYYTTDPNLPPPIYRMKRDSLVGKQKLGGIRRAMTIIARAYMFKSGNENKPDFVTALDAIERWCCYPSPDENEKKRKAQNNPLSENNYFAVRKKIYNGQSRLSPEDRDKLNGWLYKYIECMESEYADRSDSKKKAAKRQGKKKSDFFIARERLNSGARGSFRYFDLDQDRNDFYAVHYEEILADACQAGPLKEYYLLARKDWKKDLRTKNRKGEMKSITKPTEDQLLKVVATYLLAKRDYTLYVEEPSAVYVKKTDVANWLDGESGLNKMDTIMQTAFLVEKDGTTKKLFGKTPIGMNNFKDSIEKSFLDLFTIVEKETYENNRKEYGEHLCYKDEVGKSKLSPYTADGKPA